MADEESPSMGTIRPLDFENEKPAEDSYKLIEFNFKKLKIPKAYGNSIVRQFSRRVRLEFEAAGLPKGSYTLAVAGRCAGRPPCPRNSIGSSGPSCIAF
ncbi:MAG: hypothetical protein HC902_00435 [Calothrix sp. SM1_5_4]|nr:hypothetical protein [Calothrix sp. SM1_5_4]